MDSLILKELLIRLFYACFQPYMLVVKLIATMLSCVWIWGGRSAVWVVVPVVLGVAFRWVCVADRGRVGGLAAEVDIDGFATGLLRVGIPRHLA